MKLWRTPLDVAETKYPSGTVHIIIERLFLLHRLLPQTDPGHVREVQQEGLSLPLHC